MKSSLLIYFFILLTSASFPQVWHQSGWSFGGKVNALVVNSKGEIFAGTNGGIYKSADEGNYWTKFESVLADEIVNCLVLNSSGYLFAGTSTGIFVSKDSGNSWTKLFTKSGVNSIGITSSGNIYAGTTFGIYSSEDQGLSWNLRLNKYYCNSIFINYNDHIFAACGFGEVWSSPDGYRWTYILNTSGDVLVISPGSDGTIFYGLDRGGIQLADKDGKINYYTGFKSKTVYCFCFDSVNNVFAGTDSGVFVSQDSFTTWTKLNNGLINTHVYSITTDTNGYLYAGTDGGVFKSINNGMNWIEINSGLNNAVITTIKSDKQGIIYSGTEGAGLYYSDDNGIAFKSTSLRNIYVNSIALGNGGEIFVGTNRGLYISSDGENFTRSLIMWEENRNIKFLTVDSNGDLYAAIDYYGICSSSDNGITWKNTGRNNEYFYGLESDGDGCVFSYDSNNILRYRNEDPVWRGTGFTPSSPLLTIDPEKNIMFASGGGGGFDPYRIYHSSDHGTSWKKTGELTGNIKALSSRNNYLFAGTYNGIYLSSDSGSTWETYNSGLSRTYIKCFTIDPSGRIFAGTNGGGVFRSNNPDVPLPVELSSFTSQLKNDGVYLKWITVTENNNYGFTIERKCKDEFQPIGFVKGNGSSSEIKQYSFFDKPIENGTYTYRLKQTDLDGSYSYSENLEVCFNVNLKYELRANYPNPFNSSTEINYEIPEEAFVVIKIFDSLGREVVTLINEHMNPGNHSVLFDAKDLTSGSYFCRLSAGNFIKTIKMVYLK